MAEHIKDVGMGKVGKNRLGSLLRKLVPNADGT